MVLGLAGQAGEAPGTPRRTGPGHRPGGHPDRGGDLDVGPRGTIGGGIGGSRIRARWRLQAAWRPVRTMRVRVRRSSRDSRTMCCLRGIGGSFPGQARPRLVVMIGHNDVDALLSAAKNPRAKRIRRSRTFRCRHEVREK